jgi:hypothetical protein
MFPRADPAWPTQGDLFVEFVRLLLVFLHLLGMAVLVGTFLLQRRAPAGGAPNAGWLHGAGLQLVTGVALQLLSPLTDADYNHMKLGIKLLVLVVIGGLALGFTLKKTSPSWLNPTLGGLVVLNVGLAVFWT